jgi:hypothetical protein
VAANSDNGPAELTSTGQGTQPALERGASDEQAHTPPFELIPEARDEATK